MKLRRVRLLGLPYDVLKQILICLVRSSDGAKHFAVAITSCKTIRELVFDTDVLRSVNFDNVARSSNCKLFQRMDTLVTRCAQAGNTEAQAVLGKIILMSCPQLPALRTEPTEGGTEVVDRGTPSSDTSYLFLKHFMPPGNLLHTDVVKQFFHQAKPRELEKLVPYIENYAGYFFKCDCAQFLHVSTDLAVATLAAITLGHVVFETICLSGCSCYVQWRIMKELGPPLDKEKGLPNMLELLDVDCLKSLIKYLECMETVLRKDMFRLVVPFRYVHNVLPPLKLLEGFASRYQRERKRMIAEFEACCRREGLV